MNEIQKERLEALEETTSRMKLSDYDTMKFANIDKLVTLLKSKDEWQKELKSGKILQLIKDPQERKIAERENKATEANNDRIKKDYIKPLDEKIKVLEIEIMVFYGVFEMMEISDEIHRRVYPNRDEE